MYNAIKFLNKEITGVSSTKREEEVMSGKGAVSRHAKDTPWLLWASG